MFRSLRSNILLLVGLIVGLTALLTLFITRNEITKTLPGAERVHAENLVNAVLLNIETEHKSIGFFRERLLEEKKGAPEGIDPSGA